MEEWAATAALNSGERSASRPGHFTPAEKVPLHTEYEVGPHSWSKRFGEKENPLLLPVIEPCFLCHPVRSLVSIPSELPRLPL